MANLRIVYDNAAARTSSIVASSTAGTLTTANLMSDRKSEVWRSTSTSATLTVTFTSSENVACVALPFCNLTSLATIRVRAYTNTGDPTPIVDTGSVLAAPSSLGGTLDWGNLPFGVNAFSYGGYTYADAWFGVVAVRKIVIDLVDSTNPAGYIECAKLVAGNYWSPVYNAPVGARMAVEETSKHDRTDAGDLMTDRGVMYKSLSIDLVYMPTLDRDYAWRILRGNGMGKPVYVSVMPDSTDVSEEQIFQIYGKLSKNSSLVYQLMNQYSTSLQIDEA